MSQYWAKEIMEMAIPMILDFANDTKYEREDLTFYPLGGDPEMVTMSGFSSGSFMGAQQMIVNSDIIKGVGLLSGGPYGLAFVDPYGTMDAWKTLIPKAAAEGGIADL